MDDSWPTCDQDGCSGARTCGETNCLAHVGAKERAVALQRFSEGGQLDVRGVRISNALFEEIVDAAPHDADRPPTLSAAVFSRATFEGDAGFLGMTFKGGVWFNGATFKGRAWFDRAIFEGPAWFDEASFESGVVFSKATYSIPSKRLGGKKHVRMLQMPQANHSVSGL